MSGSGSSFPPPPPPPTPPAPPPRSGSISDDEPGKPFWKRWWIYAIAAVVVLVVVIAAVAGGGSDGERDAMSGTTAGRTEPTGSDAPDESDAPATTDATRASDAPSTTVTPSAPEPASTTGAPVTTKPPSSGSSVPGTPDGATGDRSSPVAAGSIADIGDEYRLQVLSVTEDATAEVMTENQFNAPPPDGSRFTIVRVALGYYGLDDPQSGFLTTISAVGSGNKELDSNCGVIPDELDRFNDIFGGGVIRGNLCFITTPADAGMLQIYASTGFTGDDVFLDASATPSALADMPTITGVQAGTSSAPARRSPTPIGTSVDVGSGWSLAVTGPATDITDSVMAENQFNEPPPEGFRFVGIPVRLDYGGAGSANALTVTTKAVGDSNVAYAKGCGVIPGELDSFTDVFAGGAAEGQICFVVPSAEVGSLTVYAGALLEDATFFATQ